MKKNILVFTLIIVVTTTSVIAFYWKQKNNNVQKEKETISYSISDAFISVSKEKVEFDYTAQQLLAMSRECGNEQTENYFKKLLSKFDGSPKIIYSFKYNYPTQKPDTFVVITIPNKAKYQSIEQFKKDFNQCYAGGDAYPKMLNDKWLLFVNSCGTGFIDVSYEINGCQKAKDIIEKTLKLN